MRDWFKQHSLSLTFAVAFVIASIISYGFAKEEQNFWYDFFMNLGAGFGTGAIIFLGQRYLWEKDSDPTKPPKSNNGEAT